MKIDRSFSKINKWKMSRKLIFFYGKPQAFGPHFDTHDVFAIHFEGEKVWNIYENIEKILLIIQYLNMVLMKEIKKLEN